MDADYVFPRHRLRSLRDPSKTPLVFVACGSFSPVTYLHLRMFEMAKDYAKFHTNFEVIGGYMSPVNDAYKKPGLAAAQHRYEMLRLACEQTSDWLMVDPWEARENRYVPTARVLDHFDQQLNNATRFDESQTERPAIVCSSSEEATPTPKPIRIVLLAGSDLIQTMSQPGLWAEEDLRHILGRFGCFIIERAESEIEPNLLTDSSRSPLAMYRDHIYMVPQLVRNDVSSTKVRLFIRKGMSVEYLIPSEVVKYILQRGLYQDDLPGSTINTPMIQAARSPLLKPVPDDINQSLRGMFLTPATFNSHSTSNGTHGPSQLSTVTPPLESQSESHSVS